MSDTNYTTWVGQPVKRKDRKAFKPGQKTATVSGVTINTATNNEAFTFTDSDVVVDCVRCYISKTGVEQ